ncbi:VPLPA-CTERM sorting domain-containing protein [Albimonas sp. CAU 1670]|uniref:VPLPA-CTERM sorting domain-containing protein n=1 Tax=Albimonas sp. CAU 1670 TaxID=3032599 RepID=UPI0023D9C9A3|nr:VPLPA-CTERM sorting domain-containing protein [Albimonas sp. CAU 1670]MDF2234479.1 VPLPA-CTERM sorting domain-containing protein [Albimonas sp. CAU 1670]
MLRPLLVSSGILLAGFAPAQALSLYTGTDVGATNRAAATNAVAAEASFLSAVFDAQTETFESTGINSGQEFSGLSDGQTTISGFTLSTVDPDPGSPDLRMSDLGYATSGAGYLGLFENGSGEPAAEAVFSFATPLLGFGLMISCSSQCGASAGTGRMVVDGTDYAIDLQSPGIMFWGIVTDTPFSSVSMIIDPAGVTNETYYGIDDVSVASQLDASVPLPAAAPLLVAGLAGLGWVGRRRKA